MTGSRSREAISSLKDEEAILLLNEAIFSDRENSPKQARVLIVGGINQRGSDRHVEHHHRPDLLSHNRAWLEADFPRCG
jgi:hypothetical protein